MDTFETRTETVEEPTSRRPISSRLADIGDRIARALPPPRRGPEYSFPLGPAPVATEEDPYPTQEFRAARLELEPVDDILPRFPVTRQGYDCNAVDVHIAELEDELEDLERQLDEAQAAVPTRDAVASQIERVGEQTSAILVAAHDEAQETIRLAQAQADTMIADATSYAAELTEEATRKVTELEQRAQALDHEHERRLAELRATAGALHSLADGAAARLSHQA